MFRIALYFILAIEMLSSQARQQLDQQGYLTLPGLMSAQLLEALRQRVEELFAEEGAACGSEFKQEPGARRLANLVNKGRIFEEVIVTPDVLEAVAEVLGPQYKLSSLNVRSANPHSDCDQPLHCDSGAVADELGYSVCNSVWMLDDFTPDIGATRMVPGSHRWRTLPRPEMYEPHPQQELVTGKAGTVVVMNAHMWHGGTANRTGQPRRAMHVYYTRFDKPQQQYQKRWLSSEVQSRLSPQARRILALDDPLNDELSATGSGMSGFMK
jgi:ectoine hydroxylase-related dioxygenase (phytanoyl-CoA dioxygenase family)